LSLGYGVVQEEDGDDDEEEDNKPEEVKGTPRGQFFLKYRQPTAGPFEFRISLLGIIASFFSFFVEEKEAEQKKRFEGMLGTLEAMGFSLEVRS